MRLTYINIITTKPYMGTSFSSKVKTEISIQMWSTLKEHLITIINSRTWISSNMDVMHDQHLTLASVIVLHVEMVFWFKWSKAERANKCSLLLAFINS